MKKIGKSDIVYFEMKIIYLANIRLPTEKAHGIQIMKMCEAFANLGHKVELVTPWRFNFIKSDPFDYYGVEKNFKITKLPSLDLVWLGRIGFWVQSASFAKIASWYTLFKKTDIIYSRDEFPLWLLSFFKKNIVWEAHMPRDNVIALSLIRRISKIVTISQGLKDFYIKKGVPSERILSAHDAVDFDDFAISVSKKEIRQKLNLPIDKFIAMYIGRIDSWKGVKTLLEASKLMDFTQVVVVGEGDDSENFKKEYRNVIFTGFLPYRDLPYNQQAADVLIIPNSKKSKVSELYTSPLKVFAHMTSDIPIVASDLPSIREILNEKNSILVDPNNANALAEAIKSVLSDDVSAKKRSNQALSDVKNMHTWDKRASKIIFFIKSI